MNILITHESSGTVRDEFIKKGHSAISCDLLPTEKDGPHYQGCVYNILFSKRWDLIIAHPECTKICVSGNHVYAAGKPRHDERIAAIEYTYKFWLACISTSDRVVFENPVGVFPTTTSMPKPQYIQPYEFGEDASKRTALFLYNLAPLIPTSRINGRIVNGKERWSNQTDSGQNKLCPSPDRWKLRSKTYLGIANAMATQWG